MAFTQIGTPAGTPGRRAAAAQRGRRPRSCSRRWPRAGPAGARRATGRRSSRGRGVGLALMQAPQLAQQWERAVVLRFGRFVGLRGPGLFWIMPVRRSRVVLDRPAHHHHQLRRRADADLGHRAGQRRRGAVLDGARRREGRARSAGLRAGDQLGGADRAARHHRPHHADRPAARPRADRGRAAAADRPALEPVGRHRVVGRDARRRHPRRAPGRDVARGAGGAREAGAHHPRRGRARDRALVRGSGEARTTTTRPRCTCAR